MPEPPFEETAGIFQLRSPSEVFSRSLPSTGAPESVVTSSTPVSAPTDRGSSDSKTTPPNSRVLDLVLPAAFVNKTRKFVLVGDPGSDSFREFVLQDLDVFRLNVVHKHLWVAGLPGNARALHYQLLIGRSIVVTEHADLHLIWQDNTIFLKPLSEYLLDWRIWNDVLSTESHLFEAANGLLLSYFWLIRSKTDLKLAHESGLLPDVVDWERWSTFSRSALSKLDHEARSDINPRYIYGELRLARFNAIYRLCSATNSLAAFMRGYHSGYRQYSTFIERNFTWLLTAIIYITVVLTAMTLGLETSQLRDIATFNRVSYGFTIFSIIAPLVVLLGASLIVLKMVIFNFSYALRTRNRRRTDHDDRTSRRLQPLHQKPEK